MVLRAQCEDSLTSLYLSKKGARPKESSEGLQNFTSQYPVGLSARDGYVIGGSGVQFRYLCGAWDQLVLHLSLAGEGSRMSQYPGRAWALPLACTTQ